MRRRVVLLVCLCLGFCRIEARAQTPPPAGRVYALIVGISKYNDGLLGPPAAKAEDVARAVSDSYRNATIWKLVDENATLTKVQRCLFNDIPQIPEDSLLIIYFAGHGVRHSYPSAYVPSDLFMPLYPSSKTDYFGRAIRVNDILDSIYRTRRCNVLVFLDCCFSGWDYKNQIDYPEEKLRNLGVRAFVLSSSSGSEQTMSGLFTDSLLELWKECSEHNICLAPPAFAAEMQKRVHQKSPFMAVDFIAGNNIASCFTELVQPNWLLTCRPEPSCRFKLDVYLNDGRDPESFDPGLHGSFVKAVPRKPLKLKIGYGGDFFFEKTLTEKDLSSDGVLNIKIPIPSDLQEERHNLVHDAKAAVNLAETVKVFGANPASYLVDAAKAVQKVDSRLNTEPLLAETLRYATPNSEEHKIAALATGKEVLPVKDYSPKLLAQVESVGGHEVVASNALEKAKIAADSNDIRSAKNYTLQSIKAYSNAGKKDEIDRAVREVRPLIPNRKTRDILMEAAQTLKRQTTEKDSESAFYEVPTPLKQFEMKRD